MQDLAGGGVDDDGGVAADGRFALGLSLGGLGDVAFRRDDAGDARAYRLQVTRRAGPLLERLSVQADRLRTEYLRGISAARHAELLRDLQRIKANLLGMDSEQGPPRSHEKN